MNCRGFEEWLDQGSPAAGAGAASAHADSCGRCAALLAAEHELELALRSASIRTAPGFTDRVMARLPLDRPVLISPALPWWARAVMEPATVIALALGGMLVWGWEAMVAWIPWVERAAARLALPPVAAGLSPSGMLALEIAIGSLLALSAHALFAATSRLAQRFPLTRS
jgi:hypothetical protein